MMNYWFHFDLISRNYFNYQSRALHSFPGTHTCERLFEVDFRRVTVSCFFNGGRVNSLSFKPQVTCLSFRNHINRSYSSFPFQPLSKSRSLSYTEPMNTINFGLINGGFGFFAPYKGALSKRHFSQVPRAELPKNVLGDREERKKRTSFLAFNKHWKQSKSRVNAVKKSDASVLKDSPVENGKKVADLEGNEGQLPNTKAKKKPQPKTKKTQEKSITSTAEPALQASSKKVSQSKKSKSSKNDAGTPALEVCTNGKSPIEASLEEELSKKTTNKTRKRKPKTPVISSIDSNEALQISNVSELSTESNVSVIPSKSKTYTSVKNKIIRPLYIPSGKSVVVVESMTKDFKYKSY